MRSKNLKGDMAMLTTVNLQIEVEYDTEAHLEETIDALDTACENITPAKGTRLISVRVV